MKQGKQATPKTKPKIVLAYSGGLDTSVMLKWLAKGGYDVVAFVADVGQNEDFDAVKSKALATGASKVCVCDLKKQFVEEFVFPALKANAIYEGQYLLGTSLARPLIAKTQVDVAKREGTNILGHGCTGKGNDQVRFEFGWLAFMPDAKIVAPWKDEEWLSQFSGRSDLLKYAERECIPVKATAKKPYSTDENIAHASYESGELEDAACAPDESMFKLTVSPLEAPDKETKIAVSFEKGVPVSVEKFSDDTKANVKINGGFESFKYLNALGAKNGVGRIDIVENRFIGIKSRGVYEAPAATILWKLHKDLESVTLDREVAHLKDSLSPIVAKLVYNGFWYSPEMTFLMAAIEKSQENVCGRVYATLYKGSVFVTGRESPKSLYDSALASMDEEGGFDQGDAKGFIKLHSLRLKGCCASEAKT